MKRIKILGLCLVAVFTMAAVAVSSASAAEPAFYECAKVATKGTGKWEKGCKADKEGSTTFNDYEIKEGIAKAKLVKGTGKKATLYTKAVGGSVSCTGFKDEYKLSSPTHLSKLVSIFTGCTSLKKKCTSTNQTKVGEIKTEALQGDLGYISKSEKKVGVDLKPETAAVLAEFTCEGLEIKTAGSVIGEVGPVNTFTKTTTTKFEVVEEEQKYKNLEGGAKDVLETTINGSGPFESGQEATATNKGEELELKA